MINTFLVITPSGIPLSIINYEFKGNKIKLYEGKTRFKANLISPLLASIASISDKISLDIKAIIISKDKSKKVLQMFKSERYFFVNFSEKIINFEEHKKRIFNDIWENIKDEWTFDTEGRGQVSHPMVLSCHNKTKAYLKDRKIETTDEFKSKMHEKVLEDLHKRLMKKEGIKDVFKKEDVESLIDVILSNFCKIFVSKNPLKKYKDKNIIVPDNFLELFKESLMKALGISTKKSNWVGLKGLIGAIKNFSEELDYPEGSKMYMLFENDKGLITGT